MKRIVILFATFILATSITALAIYGTGWGKTVTVTGTTQRIDAFTANELTVLNGGVAIVYALVNCTTNTMDTRYTAGTTVAIPGGMSFTFDSQGKDSIDSVCLRTAGATNVCYIGAY